MVQMVKASISRQLAAGETLDILQTQALLHRVANILNHRPLTARSFGVEDFMAVTPRDLLLGAAPSMALRSHLAREGVVEPPERLSARVRQVEERVESWWIRFYEDVFPLLV